MAGDEIVENKIEQREKIERLQRNIPKAQEAIYDFLLDIVKVWDAADVLAEFKQLFIHHASTISSHTLPYLYDIVFSNQEQEFRYTLKRSCYILVNNWDVTRNYEAIRQLVELFSDPILQRHTISPTLRRLRSWVKNFVESQDFQELKLFVLKYETRKSHWTERFTSYLLVPQYINLENSIEQRQAARNLSKQLQEKFKFDLARYTALSPSSQVLATAGRSIENPTTLGDETLRLVKRIVLRKGFFSHPNIARIFLNQVQTVDYQQFKKSLVEYLIFSIEHHQFAATLKQQLSEKLNSLYAEHHQQPISNALILRTAKRVVDCLTTEDTEEPTSLFILLLSQGNALTLVIVLLKLVLICHHVRTHLEARIAAIVQYYEQYPETECQWIIQFLEIFSITMTIYTENVEYSLVSMNQQQNSTSATVNLNTYRIFSQLKQATLALPPESPIDAANPAPSSPTQP